MRPLRTIGATVLATSLATAPTPVHAGAHAGAPPNRVGLQVDASALGEDAGPVSRQIEQRAHTLWLEAEVLPARGDEDPVLHLEVAPIAGADDSYRLRGSLTGAGEPTSPVVRVCELCTETELVDLASAIVAELLPKAATSDTPTEDPPPAGPPEDGNQGANTSTPSEEVGPEGPRKPPGLGPLGKAGIGVGVVGLVGLAAGLGLALTPEKTSGDGAEVVSYRPAGYTILGIGGAALVTGVALIIVDRTRAKKASPRTTWTPTLLPSGAGLAVVGRF